MSGREHIEATLRANDIDPDEAIQTDSGTRTAYEIAEAHLMAAMDEIEEGQGH
tara:strand:+ start:170231 stop:170389 length:159 start_codon:yes stop_codon:yes gene_type:complete